MAKVLVVVDMLNDFIDKKGALYVGQTGRDIIPFIQNKVAEFRANGDEIVYVCDAHDESDLEFTKFPKHAVASTWGAEIISELKPDEDAYDLSSNSNEYVIPKTRYSAFYNTEMGDMFEDGVEDDVEIEVVGCCTAICVMNTVADFANRDYKVRVFKDGVADFDPEAHTFALKYMKNILGAEVV